MLVRERMSRKVVTIDADRPVTEASRLLLRHRIRQLPVLRDGHLVGMITHRDLRGAPPQRKTVATLMTAKPFVITPDASVDEAARMLRLYKIGGLPVMEGRQLVGILTVSDVLDAFVTLSGVGEATYRIVATGPGGKQMEARARRAVSRRNGDLKWLHRDARQQPQQLHLRVKIKHVDDIVEALEAEGFEILRVVAAARAR